MTDRPTASVEQLPHYGKHFPFIPWSLTSKLRVSWVFASELRRALGWPRFVAFWLALPFRLPTTLRHHAAGFREMRLRFGAIAEAEWVLLVVIHGVLERRDGATAAYDFARRAIQRASTFMMADFYQADLLARFEDPFEAFWAYHRAMFSDDPNYPNELLDVSDDLKVMVVHECRNCQIATMTLPELAPLGCDHDITGYKAIEERTGMEFRRPVTLAKDGQPCRFMFYRAGTAPEEEVH
ncbi:MAG: L-2-amino-thiazoline-4-carboxylic acid hydrolase [Actinomycetales bacterium]|nr:L-2-amino-thiazoline-4-carboxylic acid hydrolase [Actinomycetales bacterium]